MNAAQDQFIGMDHADYTPLEWALRDYLKNTLKAPEAAEMVSTIVAAVLFASLSAQVGIVAEVHLDIERHLDFLRSQGITIREVRQEAPAK